MQLRSLMVALFIFKVVNQSVLASASIDNMPVFTEDKPVIMVSADKPEFIIKLKSNPTTGYSWYLLQYDDKMITPEKHRYQAPVSQLVGASGYELWTFKVKPTGFVVPQQTLIQFSYNRAWEKADDTHPLVFKITTTTKAH